MSPGPTFIIPRGIESVVRFVNNAERETSVHLHGSPSRAPFDGWAEDITRPGEYKDYYYPNFESARMLWYHDHAIGIVSIISMPSLHAPSNKKPLPQANFLFLPSRQPKTPSSAKPAPTS